jgi:hypothetical protein
LQYVQDGTILKFRIFEKGELLWYIEVVYPTMQESPLEGESDSLWQLEDQELQNLTNERVGTIVSSSEREKELQDELNKKRTHLYARLRELHENPFHNIDHAFAVHERLSILLQNLKYPEIIPTRKQLLLLESALRHDDGHVGNRYRQDVVEGAEMSNEELAVMLMESDFQGSSLSPEDISFMRNAIFATSSWQLKLSKKDRRQRDYSPTSIEEKLLVFADVGEVLIWGWGTWEKESEGINQELWRQSLPERNGFFTHVVSLYMWIKNYLNDRLRNRIEDNIREVEQQLLDADITRELIDWTSRSTPAYSLKIQPYSIEKESGDAEVVFGKMQELSKNPQLWVYDFMKSEWLSEDAIVMQINEFYPNGRWLDEVSGAWMRTGFGWSVLSYLLRQALLEWAKGVYVWGVSDSMWSFLKKNGFSQVKPGIFAKKI